MNKIIILFLLLLLLTLTGCNQTIESTEPDLSYAGLFKTEYINLPDDYRINFQNVYLSDNVLNVLSSKIIDKNQWITEPVLYRYNLTDKTEEYIIPEPINENADIDFLSYTPDMTYITVETLEYDTSLNIQKPDGEILKIAILSLFDLDSAISKMLVKGDIIYIANDNSLATIDLNGKLIYTTKFDQKLENFEVSSSGEVFVKLYYESRMIYNFSYIDDNGNIKENLELTGDVKLYNDIEILYGNEYNFYMKDNTGLYGYNKSDTEPMLIVNWLNSDINIEGVQKIIPLSNDKIITLARDYSYGDGRSIIAVSERIPEDEIKEKQIITLYAVDIIDNYLNTCILNFNRMSNDYRIITRSFYNPDDYETGITRFNTALASGDIPDILKIDNSMPMDSYIEKGLFYDIYNLIDNDKDISRDDFIQGILLPFERGGKLYDICLNFQFQALMGKKSVIGESNTWSFTEMFEQFESIPDDVTLSANLSKYTMLYYLRLYGIDEFIDKNNISCDFDSDKFIEILEIINKMPEPDNNNYIYSAEAMELMQNDKFILYDFIISTIDNYFITAVQLQDDIIIKGYPTVHGDKNTVYVYTNRCAITTQSELKDAAWEFLKYVFSDNVQSKINTAIPVTVSGLRKQFDILQNQYFLMNTNGSIIGSDTPFSESELTQYGGQKFEFTDNLYQQFLDVLNNIEKVNSTSDVIVQDIVYDEVFKMTQGIQTPVSTADSIQNRVSIYINEQYG